MKWNKNHSNNFWDIVFPEENPQFNATLQCFKNSDCMLYLYSKNNDTGWFCDILLQKTINNPSIEVAAIEAKEILRNYFNNLIPEK